MKNRLKWLFPLMFSALVLVACGDDDEVENPPQNATDETQQQNGDGNNGTNEDTNDDTNEENNDDTNNKTDSNNTNAAYPFTGFDLEADFDDTNDTLDVDYDQETNETEASYEDKTQNINLQGDAAMDELNEIFSTFEFDENTANDEVLTAVLEAFNIPDDAQNVELDIEFSSGTEKEYRK